MNARHKLKWMAGAALAAALSFPTAAWSQQAAPAYQPTYYPASAYPQYAPPQQQQSQDPSSVSYYFSNTQGPATASGAGAQQPGAVSGLPTGFPQGGYPYPGVPLPSGILGQQQPAPQVNLGSASDPNSAQYKVNKLARDAQQQRAEAAGFKNLGLSSDGLEAEPPPPDVASLQNIRAAQAGKAPDIADDPLTEEMALDMRRDAQKEAALSYGARGGLAKRNYEIMERMEGFEAALDKVFDFRALLIKAPSGMLIEPPIVKESDRALVIDASGDEAAVADKIFDINKKAKIVSAPRNWREYLVQSWSDVPPPPRVLWPKTPKEQSDWNSWIESGWDAGLDQADQIFESNLNRLVADYNGMVRYRMLLKQEMISAPYAMHEDRGIVGSGDQMRIGDRAIRITGPSQFLTKADQWKPADR